MKYVIEELNLTNIEDFARVNIQAWQESYQGIVNNDFLEEIKTEASFKETIKKLKIRIKSKDEKSFLLRVNDEPVGILNIRKSKFKKYQDYGELGAIYLLNKTKGKGFGIILFEKAKEELKKLGYDKMINSCFENNPSNEFYKHMGGLFIETTTIKLPNNQELNENVYIYESI